MDLRFSVVSFSKIIIITHVFKSVIKRKHDKKFVVEDLLSLCFRLSDYKSYNTRCKVC